MCIGVFAGLIFSRDHSSLNNILFLQYIYETKYSFSVSSCRYLNCSLELHSNNQPGKFSKWFLRLMKNKGESKFGPYKLTIDN